MAIHGLRRPAVLLLVASLAALLFIFSSATETARANLNFVGYPTSLSDTTPGANADITTLLQEPAPNSFPWGGTVAGTPNGFGIALDGADLSSGFPPGPPTGPAVPDGAVVGSLTSKVQLAVNAIGFNACFAPVIVPFAMVDSTVVGAGTTGAGTIGGSPADTIWPGNADGTGDGLPDAVKLWPTFLNQHLANLNPGGAAPVPIARYHGQILVAPPSPTNLELVFFAPGSLPDFPASMGTLSVSYLEDSLAPASPSAISMTCTTPAPATFVTTTISGTSLGAAVLFPNVGLPPAGGSMVQIDPASGIAFPGTDVCDGVDNNGVNGIDEGCGFLLRQNPSTAGSYVFKIAAITGRDTDNDGITNQLDSCPLNVDAHSHADAHAPFDPFGLVYTPPGGLGYNPYWPAPFIFNQPADPDDDNLPNSCDPNPNVPSFNGPFGVDEDIFSEGFTPPFTRFFSNGQDNCKTVGNPSQLNSDASIVAINIGPDSDFMGDHPLGLSLPTTPSGPGPFAITGNNACDPNPFVSDGHAHMDFGPGPVCVGGTDTDGDGWCASDDPDDNDASIQVEDINFDRTCFDGLDNDGVGGTDLADSKCQLPDHDLELRKIKGSRDVVCGQSNSYQVNVKNLTPDREVFKIAFLFDKIGTAVADGTDVTITALVSDGLVPGTDEVGFINHDSGGYPGPAGPFLSLATDLEVEAFATADITVNGHANRPVKVEVTWSCTGTPTAGIADYSVSVDICHLGDPTLGLLGPLFPLGDDCGLVGSDGGQDRVNTGNDATLTRTINVGP